MVNVIQNQHTHEVGCWMLGKSLVHQPLMDPGEMESLIKVLPPLGMTLRRQDPTQAGWVQVRLPWNQGGREHLTPPQIVFVQDLVIHQKSCGLKVVAEAQVLMMSWMLPPQMNQTKRQFPNQGQLVLRGFEEEESFLERLEGKD